MKWTKEWPLSQVTSYYYSSSVARQFSKDQELSLSEKKIYLVTQAPVTGWSSEDNTIYLGVHPTTQQNSGLDASIILNLISEANIYYASQGLIYEKAHSTHKDCQGKKEMCCLNEQGCSKAITIGLSHYFSSYFFRQAPTVGESYSNRLKGIEDCSISRDLNESQNVSMEEAFDACEEKGYVYPMATVYASIWWNVLNQILEEDSKETNLNLAASFQVFYLKHLESLKGDFNFIDAFSSMKKLDDEKFEAQFTNYFRSEFIRRGINL